MHHGQRSRFLPALLLSTLVTTAVAPRAFADNKATAEQLYVDAKKMMDDGKAAEACPKLEESMRLDPADGTELRLATCYEKIGRYASSWSLYRTALTKAKKANNAQRIDFATAHLAIVEPKVSKVTLALDPGAEVPGLIVKLDEDTIGAGAFGTAIPEDPGAHKLLVSAPGKKAYETTVTVVGEGQQQTVKIPLLESADVAVAATDAEPSRGWAPYVVGGVGMLFLAGTIGARVAVSAAQAQRQSECATQRAFTCDDTNVSKIQTWDKLSYVFGGLAVVGLGVSVILYTTSGPTSSPGSKVGAGPAAVAGAPGFQIQGNF